MANIYYIHQSVKNPQEASIFSDVYTWTILDVLRSAGNNGLSAEKVHHQVEKKLRTSVSKSKIYGLLRRLYQMDWVHRIYDKRDQAYHSTVHIDYGGILLDKDYDDILVKKEREYILQRLFPIFLDYINKTIKDLANDPNAKRWLPQPNNSCKMCQVSHEAEEFISSVLDLATVEFMDSEEYKKILIEHHFREKDEDND
jgi:predicted transcriptional regulator